ncbi:MAG TPA: ribosome small subunit-dependent GTPase A [Gammaproteobacteria bacterium]|jgi:ribosome biogenesis GTPase|nr:ribosome small subunit-dependent GTPase A [Gammaproteobacteria bacterium]
MTGRREVRVVAGSGRRFVVETPEGERRICLTANRALQVVCGDRVHIDDAAEPRILDFMPRASLFSKADNRGRSVPAAANLDRILMVLAPIPAPELFLMDKYLASIEGMGIEAGIVLNKMDLVDKDDDGGLGRRLDYLGRLGYPIHRVSSHGGAGLESFAAALRGHESMLVGQSGVGKSSLLNALVPQARHRIDELSAATDEGRHTTTATTWHPLAQGGALVDSPGVRDLELVIRDPGQISPLFRDFREPASRCRFANCLHLQEPGCAVKEAVEKKEIPESRYTSYRWLMTTMQQAKDRKYD